MGGQHEGPASVAEDGGGAVGVTFKYVGGKYTTLREPRKKQRKISRCFEFKLKKWVVGNWESLLKIIVTAFLKPLLVRFRTLSSGLYNKAGRSSDR